MTDTNRGVAPNGGASLSTAVNALLIPAQALLRSAPLAQPVVVVKTLSNAGGVIDVPGADFQLQVPSGAFAAASMTFTITAYAGNVVAYDFQPHGVTFLKPLNGVQQLRHTNWRSLKVPSGFHPLAGAYFADSSQINLMTGKARVNEFMPTGYTVNGNWMWWDIPHFSGYLVVAGREAGDDGSSY